MKFLNTIFIIPKQKNEKREKAGIEYETLK